MPDEFNFSHIIKHLFGVHSVRIILLVGILLFAVSHGFNSWLPKLLESSGLSPTAAGFYSSIPFITGIPAVLIIPRLTPAGFRGPMIALLALLAALTIILTSTMTLPLLLSLLLYGIAGGSLVPLVILTLMETPGVDSEYHGCGRRPVFLHFRDRRLLRAFYCRLPGGPDRIVYGGSDFSGASGSSYGSVDGTVKNRTGFSSKCRLMDRNTILHIYKIVSCITK